MLWGSKLIVTCLFSQMNSAPEGLKQYSLSTPKDIFRASDRLSLKGIAHHGIDSKYCSKEVKLRSDVTKITSNFFPLDFNFSYVFISSAVNTLHGGH